LERGVIYLSNGMSFINVGWEAKKLLRVEVNNLCYFGGLIAYVTFITYFLAWVTFSFLLSYILDFYSYFYFRDKQFKFNSFIYSKLRAESFEIVKLSYRINFYCFLMTFPTL